MKLGMTLYIENSLEAVTFYQEAFGLDLGDFAKYPDGTYLHAPLYKNGQEIFAVSEAKSDNLVSAVHHVSAKGLFPIASHGLDFDTEEELRRAYEILAKDGVVIRAPGKLPWDGLSTDVVDKYGVCWYLVKWKEN